MLEKSYEINVIMFIAISILLIIRSLDNDISSQSNLQLQLATFVTIIAASHYFLMVRSKKHVVSYRYFDWFFTTPILLIDLCLLLKIYDIKFISEIIIYNTIMLFMGFLGELELIPLYVSNILGFIPFIMMYKKISDKTKIQQEKHLVNGFFGLWSLYGVNQLNPFVDGKNITYNILDFITKGAFGLYIYYESM
jgi:bacteriorhodopsin